MFVKDRAKVRKKVSFNMDLQIYEPISTSYHSMEEEEEMKNNDEEIEGSLSTSCSKKSFPAFSMRSFHSHYRYQHCGDCYDEEDILAFNESELEDLDDDFANEYDANNIGDDNEHSANDYDCEFPIAVAQGINQGVSDSEQFCSVSKSSQLRVSKESSEGKSTFTMPSCVSTKEDSLLCRNATNEGQNTFSVLNPVENLTQWREVKAKLAYKHQKKENQIAFEKTSRPSSNPSPFSLVTPCYDQSKRPLQNIAIDASLSSWLNSPRTNMSGQKSIISNSSIAVRTM